MTGNVAGIVVFYTIRNRIGCDLCRNRKGLLIHPLPIDLLFKPNIHDDDAFLYIVSREVKTGNLIGKRKQAALPNTVSPCIEISAANAFVKSNVAIRKIVSP